MPPLRGPAEVAGAWGGAAGEPCGAAPRKCAGMDTAAESCCGPCRVSAEGTLWTNLQSSPARHVPRAKRPHKRFSPIRAERGCCGCGSASAAAADVLDPWVLRVASTARAERAGGEAPLFQAWLAAATGAGDTGLSLAREAGGMPLARRPVSWPASKAAAEPAATVPACAKFMDGWFKKMPGGNCGGTAGVVGAECVRDDGAGLWRWGILGEWLGEAAGEGRMAVFRCCNGCCSQSPRAAVAAGIASAPAKPSRTPPAWLATSKPMRRLPVEDVAAIQGEGATASAPHVGTLCVKHGCGDG